MEECYGKHREISVFTYLSISTKSFIWDVKSNYCL